MHNKLAFKDSCDKKESSEFGYIARGYHNTDQIRFYIKKTIELSGDVKVKNLESRMTEGKRADGVPSIAYVRVFFEDKNDPKKIGYRDFTGVNQQQLEEMLKREKLM